MIAVDLLDEKLALARELGTELTVNAREQDPVEAIKTRGGADEAISLAVSPQAFEPAYGTLCWGRKLVFVALPADNEVKLPIFETVPNGITMVGSIVGARTYLREVFELHAAGKTKVIREIRPLDQLNESIGDVEAWPRSRQNQLPPPATVLSVRRLGGALLTLPRWPRSEHG